MAPKPPGSTLMCYYQLELKPPTSWNQLLFSQERAQASGRVESRFRVGPACDLMCAGSVC